MKTLIKLLILIARLFENIYFYLIKLDSEWQSGKLDVLNEKPNIHYAPFINTYEALEDFSN